MISVIGKKTKKALRESIGTAIRVNDPNIMGNYTGNGEYAVVGPSVYDRRWYAVITVKDGILKTVK